MYKRQGLGSKKWGPKVGKAGENCCQLEQGRSNKKNSRGGEKSARGIEELFRALKIDENPYLKEGGRLKKVKDLVRKYQDIFVTENRKVGKVTQKEFKLKLRLKEGAKPVAQNLRPMHPRVREALKKQMEDWAKERMIERSELP